MCFDFSHICEFKHRYWHNDDHRDCRGGLFRNFEDFSPEMQSQGKQDLFLFFSWVSLSLSLMLGPEVATVTTARGQSHLRRQR